MNFSRRFGNDFIRLTISSRVSFTRFGRSILTFFNGFIGDSVEPNSSAHLAMLKDQAGFFHLSPIVRLNQKSFSRPHARIGLGLHANAQQMITGIRM